MTDTRYIITVTQIATERKILPKRWEKGGGGDPENYGYAPEVETLQVVERKVFEQNTDTLDLVAVIAAVNNL